MALMHWLAIDDAEMKNQWRNDSHDNTGIVGIQLLPTSPLTFHWPKYYLGDYYYNKYPSLLRVSSGLS